MSPNYDAFISYRWNEDDGKISLELFHALLQHTVGSVKRSAQVFYDEIRIRPSQHIQKTFGNALIKSTIVVPILSTAALQRMITHNPLYEDNVLIEWMLALECMQSPIHSNLRGISPLMFGKRKQYSCMWVWLTNFFRAILSRIKSNYITDNEYFGTIFMENMIERLPETIPHASIEVVRALLKENGLEESPSLARCTVRSVFRDITKYSGLKGWDYVSKDTPLDQRYKRVAVEASQEIAKQLNKCADDALCNTTSKYS